jgi:hypothetical protein
MCECTDVPIWGMYQCENVPMYQLDDAVSI